MRSLPVDGLQVNIPERLLVLSERAAYMADLSKTLKQGDVVDGIVRNLTDYGAFVSIRASDGSLHGTDVSTAACSYTYWLCASALLLFDLLGAVAKLFLSML